MAPLSHPRMLLRRLIARWALRPQDTAPIDDVDQWVRTVLQRLQLAPPFSLDELLDAARSYLQCAIIVEVRDFEGSALYGACYPTHNAYAIAIGHNLTRRQVVRTVLHELAHILRGHIQATDPQYREFEPTTPQDLEAEEIARVMEGYMDAPLGRDNSRRSLGERLWRMMGGQQS